MMQRLRPSWYVAKDGSGITGINPTRTSVNFPEHGLSGQNCPQCTKKHFEKQVARTWESKRDLKVQVIGQKCGWFLQKDTRRGDIFGIRVKLLVPRSFSPPPDLDPRRPGGWTERTHWQTNITIHNAFDLHVCRSGQSTGTVAAVEIYLAKANATSTTRQTRWPSLADVLLPFRLYCTVQMCSATWTRRIRPVEN